MEKKKRFSYLVRILLNSELESNGNEKFHEDIFFRMNEREKRSEK